MAYSIDSIDSEFGVAGSKLTDAEAEGLRAILVQLKAAITDLDTRITALEP